MDLMLRRRQLMAAARIIGYTPGMGYARASTPPVISSQEDFFITGYIPFKATNGSIALTAKYSDNGFKDDNQHFVVFYDANKQVIYASAYYDMTVINERTVSSNSALVTGPTRFIRFCGRMDSIDICYIKDSNTNKILWKKGM